MEERSALGVELWSGFSILGKREWAVYWTGLASPGAVESWNFETVLVLVLGLVLEDIVCQTAKLKKTVRSTGTGRRT